MTEMTQIELEALGVILPPTEDELPCDDGIPMETQRHALQLQLLIDPLRLYWTDRQDVYVGGNMFVYFSLEQVRHQDFRGPDFFVVLGVPRRERKSWVVWQEGKGPGQGRKESHLPGSLACSRILLVRPLQRGVGWLCVTQ
jgi:Uma2 family endonuclease